MKSELQELQRQIRSVEDLVRRAEEDIQHVGWVAAHRISFIGGGLMLKLASNSLETVALTPISQKGLFKAHEVPEIRSDSSCVFTLKRTRSPISARRGLRLVESSSSQATLVDVAEAYEGIGASQSHRRLLPSFESSDVCAVVENLSKCSLNEEDRFSNTSFYTAAEEEYEMTDLSDTDDSDEESDKPVPDWAKNAEASWLKAKSKYAAESIFKLVDLDLTSSLDKMFGREGDPLRRRRSSGQWS
jgi:hypothetical protein